MRISSILMVLLLIGLAGGAFLATWEIPAPSAPVERVIPDDTFPSY